jgi:hypothetical protein
MGERGRKRVRVFDSASDLVDVAAEAREHLARVHVVEEGDVLVENATREER